MADPIALAAHIYAFAQVPFTAQTESRLAGWVLPIQRERRAHVSTAEQFGLSNGELREGFAKYRSAVGFE